MTSIEATAATAAFAERRAPGFDTYEIHLDGCSEAVVSRAMQKLAAREFIAVERWNKVGINRIRLTGRGRDLLLSAGVPLGEKSWQFRCYCLRC